MMKPSCGICILAGGLSARMGRDKARLRLGGKTLLAQIRATAGQLGLSVRVLRRDLTPRCGPLGGIYTGLKTSAAEAELFLACDMPLVSAELLAKLLTRFRLKPRPLFAAVDGLAGFPFVLPVASLPRVEAQIARRDFSLQALAGALEARLLRVSPGEGEQLLNANTPEEWEATRALWRRRAAPRRSPSPPESKIPRTRRL